MVQSYKKKTICKDFSAFLLYKIDIFLSFCRILGEFILFLDKKRLSLQHCSEQDI